MRVQEIAGDGFIIIQLEGEVDMATSPELRETLDAQTKLRQPVLLFDFTQVTYIDSSGLATLVEYCRNVQGWGGKLGLYGLNERVRTVFEIVRLDEFLGLYATGEEARAALGVPA